MSIDRHIELELGVLQMQILWMLSKSPRSGYDLMKELNGIKSTTVNQGTLYPTLRRLSGLGLIGVCETGGRGKKVYSLTEEGKKQMNLTCENFCRIFGDIFKDFECMSCGVRK